MQPEQRIIIEQVSDPVWIQLLIVTAGAVVAGIVGAVINKRRKS
jgi:hypothetical protein